MKPGNYKATINTAYVQEDIGDNKNSAFIIDFKLSSGEFIKWFGWMTEKAYPYTLEQLGKLGFNENISPLRDASGDSYFDGTYFSVKEVDLVLVEDGKYTKIKYINIPGASKFSGSTPQKGKLPSDFKAEMQAARARLGLNTPKKEEAAPF